MFNDFINGFLLELSLVMTVGLQSAFILKQGIRREFVIIAVLTCFFSETLLVTIGIAGMGALVRSIPHLNQIITGIGIVFLFFYAGKSLYAAVKKNDYIIIDNEEKGLVSKKEVLLSGLAFALLNPHVIIDTTIMGSLAANFYPHHWVFGAGVISAAFVWYAFLGTVGATLAKPLNKPKTWKVINILIAALFLGTALISGVVTFATIIEQDKENGVKTNYVEATAKSIVNAGTFYSVGLLAANIGKLGTTSKIDTENIQFSNTVLKKIHERRPYINSRITMDEIIMASKPTKDPIISSWLRWDVPGSFNNSYGKWELVINPSNNTVYHFLFRSNK